MSIEQKKVVEPVHVEQQAFEGYRHDANLEIDGFQLKYLLDDKILMYIPIRDNPEEINA